MDVWKGGECEWGGGEGLDEGLDEGVRRWVGDCVLYHTVSVRFCFRDNGQYLPIFFIECLYKKMAMSAANLIQEFALWDCGIWEGDVDAISGFSTSTLGLRFADVMRGFCLAVGGGCGSYLFCRVCC